MNELVFLQNEQALTTSLKVAERFEKRHNDVLRAIETAKTNLRNFAHVEKAITPSTYLDAKGEKRPMYLLNRDGFSFVVMRFTGVKAAEWQWKFIQEFNAMEQKIIELVAERKSEEWRRIRQAGKQGNKDMCAVIDQYLLPLAREQGYDKPPRLLYINYQRAVNRAAGVKPKSRDEQPIGQLYEIEKLQDMVKVSVKGQAARGDHFKQIYRDTNQLLESYSRLSLIPERFLMYHHEH